MRTGEQMACDPALMLTKSTGIKYSPGAEHPDWDQALTALPADVLPWYQIRIGQGATGYMPPDDAVLVNLGAGANGKTTILMGICHALGDYFMQTPPEALFGDHSQHPTVRMTFRGAASQPWRRRPTKAASTRSRSRCSPARGTRGASCTRITTPKGTPRRMRR